MSQGKHSYRIRSYKVVELRSPDESGVLYVTFCVPLPNLQNGCFPLGKGICGVENWKMNCFKNTIWLMCSFLLQITLKKGVQLCLGSGLAATPGKLWQRPPCRNTQIPWTPVWLVSTCWTDTLILAGSCTATGSLVQNGEYLPLWNRYVSCRRACKGCRRVREACESGVVIDAYHFITVMVWKDKHLCTCWGKLSSSTCRDFLIAKTCQSFRLFPSWKWYLPQLNNFFKRNSNSDVSVSVRYFCL